MPLAEVFPFADIGDTGSYPDWIRGLRKVSGVYVIRLQYSGDIAYVGESSTDRLYSTLTRHFQAWTNKYDTAGATYDRDRVQVAVIVVPREHANFLQNELICALRPADNRLVCNHLFDPDDPESFTEPPGYDYDVDLIMQGIAYEWPEDDGEDMPF